MSATRYERPTNELLWLNLPNPQLVARDRRANVNQFRVRDLQQKWIVQDGEPFKVAISEIKDGMHMISKVSLFSLDKVEVVRTKEEWRSVPSVDP